ncbi:hypothetical protein LAZ67_4001561 [Cordylochernes scorpioides]|uniref:Transposase n=1 Tax=Cordylochernes scorpioides TaxID=51811 RepID=A0ABY6KC35_9ARAC|nr:hypothetical protein LAZ67_4001561 [Cordylochernes scorpioides]
MHGTTTGEDIFNCVYDLLQKYNLPQSKLTSVATDGAPSMTGKTNGFVALLREKLSEISDGSNIHHTHCIIHQEVLCTKVIKMENVLTPIKKFINFIRSRGLNQRQFSLFLTELESEYSGLSYYTERVDPGLTFEHHTGPQQGVMLWDAISFEIKSPLGVIPDTLKAERYIDDILRPVLLPFLSHHPGFTFQQDNGRPHTARVTMDCLQSCQTLPWPARSPDLSPIESTSGT